MWATRQRCPSLSEGQVSCPQPSRRAGRSCPRARLRSAFGCQAPGAGAGHCTTRRQNAHRIEEREVVYPWHPWSGCIVQIYQVVEKSSGDVVRCSRGDEVPGRWLELPLWMFDRAECTLMRVATAPRVNLVALSALAVLLTEARSAEAAMGMAAPSSPEGAGYLSHEANRGDVHATTAACSPQSAEQTAPTRSVRTTRRLPRDSGAGLAGAPGDNARGFDDTDHAADPRPRARRVPEVRGRGAT